MITETNCQCLFNLFFVDFLSSSITTWRVNLQTTQKFRTLHTQTVAVTANRSKVVAQNRVIMGVIAAVAVAMAGRHLYKRKSNKKN